MQESIIRQSPKTSRPAIKFHLEQLLHQEGGCAELFDFAMDEIDQRCGLISDGVLKKVKPNSDGERNMEDESQENQMKMMHEQVMKILENSPNVDPLLKTLLTERGIQIINFYQHFIGQLKEKNIDLEDILIRDQIEDQLHLPNLTSKDLKFNMALSILLKMLLSLKIYCTNQEKGNIVGRSDQFTIKIDVKKYFSCDVEVEDWVADLTERPLCVLKNIHSKTQIENSYSETLELKNLLNLEDKSSYSQKELHVITSLLDKSKMTNGPTLPNLGRIVKLDSFISREQIDMGSGDQNRSKDQKEDEGYIEVEKEGQTKTKIDFEKILASKKAGQIFSNGLLDKSDSKEEAGAWCLTLIPDSNQISIKRFTDSFPLQIKPLSSADILSYQNYQIQPSHFIKVCTKNYIQSGEINEYMSVFYNCGKSQIEWISYLREGTQKLKINQWSSEDVDSLVKSGVKIHRTIQKSHQAVVIPSGHEYLWKMVNPASESLGVLLGWNVLLKSKNQIVKFIEISSKKAEISALISNNSPKVPTSKMFLNFISHEYSKISDKESLEQMINAIMTNLKREEDAFAEMASASQQLSILIKMEELRPQNSFCQYCLTQILNYYAMEDTTIHCIDCLKIRLNEICSNAEAEISLCMIGKPTTIRNMLRLIAQSKVYEEDKALNVDYEEIYCREGYPGSIDYTFCLHSSSIPESKYPHHIFSMTPQPRLQLEYLHSRISSFTVNKIIKICAWMEDKSRFDRGSLLYALFRLAKYAEDRENLCKDISSRVSPKNQVLYAMNLLMNSSDSLVIE